MRVKPYKSLVERVVPFIDEATSKDFSVIMSKPVPAKIAEDVFESVIVNLDFYDEVATLPPNYDVREVAARFVSRLLNSTRNIYPSKAISLVQRVIRPFLKRSEARINTAQSKLTAIQQLIKLIKAYNLKVGEELFIVHEAKTTHSVYIYITELDKEVRISDHTKKGTFGVQAIDPFEEITDFAEFYLEEDHPLLYHDVMKMVNAQKEKLSKAKERAAKVQVNRVQANRSKSRVVWDLIYTQDPELIQKLQANKAITKTGKFHPNGYKALWRVLKTTPYALPQHSADILWRYLLSNGGAVGQVKEFSKLSKEDQAYLGGV